MGAAQLVIKRLARLEIGDEDETISVAAKIGSNNLFGRTVMRH